MLRAVFLDRDGVLNQAIVRDGKPYPPASLAELSIADDVLPALQQLKAAGYLLLGATNQPDVVRGKTARETVEAMNAHLMQVLPLDEMRVCYHDDHDQCACRKPKPGLILSAAEKFGVDVTKSFMIGDRWRDVEAGQQAGCKTVWINVGYQERGPLTAPDKEAKNLSEAAAWILNSKD